MIALGVACSPPQHVRERSARELVDRMTGTSAGAEIWEWRGAVVDRTINLVGSYNLDPRRTFLEHDVRTSRQFTVEEAARFERPESVRERFKKQFAGMFEDQL